MEFPPVKSYSSHGSGLIDPGMFKSMGENVIIEPGVQVFHPETISLSDNVYIGHSTILKGYHRNEMRIGRDVWIGQGCFIHSAGGVTVGRAVGIGPCVKIFTSVHKDENPSQPVIAQDLVMKRVEIGDGCDIGIGAILLPGIRIGTGAVVGAGAVVTHDVPDYHVVAGNPARILRKRGI